MDCSSCQSHPPNRVRGRKDETQAVRDVSEGGNQTGRA
jgi:hypothetical protein